ncbi:MAG: AsnC family transcriptional regulator [Candidatus Methanomethylophilaceae archaeon]|nr:AsnC family transcriptional regulator [Candidatus Methanomethylophilaceae archaeon]
MDETDLMILMRLTANARTPYRELSDHFQMSVAAIHKRIQGMTEEGVIAGYKLIINPFYKGAFPVMVRGYIGDRKMPQYEEFLASDDRNYQFILTGGRRVYLAGMLHGMSEVSEWVEKVRKAFDLQDSQVLFDKDTAEMMDRIRDREYDPEFQRKDMRILSELQKDPRAALSDVAEKVGFTSKFVSRRLNRLLEQRWVQFRVDFNLVKAKMMVTIMDVHCLGDDGKALFIDCLKDIRSSTLLQAVHFTNVPDEMMVLYTSWDVDALRSTVRELESCPGVKEISPNIIYDFRELPTWIDKSLHS